MQAAGKGGFMITGGAGVYRWGVRDFVSEYVAKLSFGTPGTLSMGLSLPGDVRALVTPASIYRNPHLIQQCTMRLGQRSFRTRRDIVEVIQQSRYSVEGSLKVRDSRLQAAEGGFFLEAVGPLGAADLRATVLFGVSLRDLINIDLHEVCIISALGDRPEWRWKDSERPAVEVDRAFCRRGRC